MSVYRDLGVSADNRPQALSPGIWASLLVFAHKTDLIPQPGGQAPVDPSKQVEDIARDYFRDAPVRQASEDARSEVFRGARLRIAPDLPGIQCDPGEAEFGWQKPVHQVVFRILAEPDRVGSVVRGAVRVWCGPLLLSEVSLAISITASTARAGLAAVPESAPRYRKIFPSYSHDDRPIVDDCAEVARALGDQYLQDVLALRSGERWRARLSELIDEADIFQLFWSSNSMRSQYCREEWEHALALGRPLFVRPMYWEDPLPRDPAMGLPPAALRELEFVKYRPHPTHSGTPASPEKVPDTSPGLSAPTDASPPYAPPHPGPERLDTQGEVHEALNSVVSDYGQQILSNPHMIGNLVTDLLPDLPRERSLLVTAAEADVASDLTRHVEEHHLDPDTAVQLVARSLTDRRALDPAVSTWVTSEYAQALGYRMRSDTAPPADQVPEYGYPGYSQPQQPSYSQPQQHGYPTFPAGRPQQGPPPPPCRPPPVQAPTKRSRRPIFAVAGTAVALVIFASAAGVLNSASPPPTATSVPTSSPHPTVNQTPNPLLAAGVAPLVQLLPSDVNLANCKAASKAGWATPDLVQSLACLDSGVGSGDSIFAYQMNSSANYQASWANFNTFVAFSPPAGSDCPPSGSNTQGITPWDDTGSGGNGFYPTVAGQTLECGFFFSSNNLPEPTYAWSFPSEDAYVIAIADPNTAFAALDTWWRNYAGPKASPSPAAP